MSKEQKFGSIAPIPTSTPEAIPASQNVPQVNTTLQQPTYVSRLQGIPVEPGQDLRHVHPNVIRQWFRNLENQWKARFGMQSGGLNANLNLTQGN